MKKILSLLLVLALLLALTACGAPAQVPEETAAPTEAATEAPAEEITEAPTEEPTEAEPVIRSPMRLELPQAEITDPAEKTEVPADASWAALSSDILAPDAMKSSSEPSDPYRPWYDLGVSTQMEGDVFTLLIFMDDYESSWTYEEIEAFCTNKYYPAETWLCQQARNWGASINFSSGYYGSDATVRVPYYGIVGDFSGNLNNDIMDQAATSIGFADKEALHQRMVEYSGTDNICYVVVVDKPGRSYAMMDWYNDGYENMEYAMLFAQPLYVGDLVYDCPPATVAHEMLHTFGAEDFYAEGDARNGRARLAAAYYPYGIMYQTYYDINYNYVDQFTAYAVGWTDSTPNVCYDSSWWN